MNTPPPSIGYAPTGGIKKSTIIWICVGVAMLFLLMGGCSTYNNIKKDSIEVDAKWGDVQAQYQRRFDLFPNLVSTVKAAAKHEQNTLQGVTNARVGLPTPQVEPMNPTVLKAQQEMEEAVAAATPAFNGPNGTTAAPDPAKYQRAEQAYSMYINAVHEAYPQITATENFKQAQAEITGTQNRVTTAVMRYNEAVKQYNVSIATFPRNIVAGIFGFQDKAMFQADAAAQKNPELNYD